MSAKLEFLSGKRKGDVFEFDASGEEFGIGNRKSAQIRVRDPWISYKHAKICLDGGRFFIEDLGSSNGTWVDGERIERRALEPGMLLYLGKTKIKFLQEGPAPAQAAPGGGQAWWDKVIEGDAAQAPSSDAVQAQLKRLEAEVSEERGMRRALERFLDVPEGSQLGDAAQAGTLEAEKRALEAKLEELEGQGGSSAGGVEAAVAEATERLRRDHMSQVVELEARAKQFESRAIDFEGRLKDRAESAKSELKRVKEGYEAELEQLRTSLEEARKSDGEGAASEHSAQLEQDLTEARTQVRELEEALGGLKAELEEARSAPSAEGAEDPDELKSQVWAAVEEATRWKEEARQAKDQLELAQAEAQAARAKHDEVVQEIDEISMEQIEIEEELNAKLGLLKERLVAASGQSLKEVEAELAAALASQSDSEDESDGED